MGIRRPGLWLAAGTALLACSACSPGGGAKSQAGTGSGSSGSGGSSGSSSGQPGGGGSNGQLGVTLQNSGRHGGELLFTVQGSDPAGQTTEVQVRLLDASNAPVIAFDTNWDGVPDSAEQRIHFDQSTLGQTTFKQTITLPRLYAKVPSIASAIVSLSDVNGNRSPAVTANLQPQAVRKQGAQCDPNTISDRCAEGLSCQGKPSTCQPATPPSLTQVAYYGGNTPAQLFLGADPAEDLVSLTVDFLDSNGKPVIVDLSGDGTPASSVVLDARGAPGQTFFLENYPVADFASAVPKISVTATDSFGKVSSPVVASLASQPVLTNGKACDARGFATCATDFVCAPGLLSASNRCTAVASLQTNTCSGAPEAMAAGLLAAWGLVEGVSLWEPPAGCAASTAVGRPESIVMLKLAHPLSKLTISTATPETDFDTVLYVLPGCAASAADALGCNDDTQGFSSTVTLTNVAAGTYAIVVDAVNAQAGHFGLTISTQ